MKFYIKICNNPKILDSDEINEFYKIYNDIKFININKEFIENKDGDIDILKHEENSDSD